MKPSTTAWVVIVILIIAGAAWYFVSAQNGSVTTEDTSQTQLTGTGTTTNDTPDTPLGADVGASVGTAPMSATINLTANGFSPSSVTIAKGGTVTFVNQGNGQMWIGADEHPTHTQYDSTSRTTHCAAGYTGPKPFDQCAPGSSFSFTFDKTGTFQFHNHINASMEGTVVVK